MDSVIQTIEKFLTKYSKDIHEEVYLVAFSGGYDSMCLLHALKRVCNNRIIAIHLNHNWRGKESDTEEQNCKNFCSSIGVEFYSEKLPDDVEKTETAAREERYNFFERCAEKFNAKVIFTAHNKNDNAETLLYRIAKGTGIKGLQGISENRGIYYRPLLEIDRSLIEQYCRDNNLKPNNDSSNNDIIHNRNLIRNKIIPDLSQINPLIIDSLDKLSKNAEEDNQIIGEYLEVINEKICKNGKYDIKKYLHLSEPVQMRILYELVVPLVPQKYDRLRFEILHNFIKENVISKSGKVCSVTSGYDLFVCDKYFKLIVPQAASSTIFKVDKCGTYNMGGVQVNIYEYGSDLNNKELCVYNVDLSGCGLNFELRTRRDGDIIQPFGMSGHQKLKKYLNSRKIPNHEKDKLILLARGNEVYWVCGVGTSEKIRVSDKPTHKIVVKEEVWK